MEFKLINPSEPIFGDTILSKERQDELSKQLDNMTKSWNPNEAIRVCNIMVDIASYCNTVEEMTYCVLLHMGWWQRKGILI